MSWARCGDRGAGRLVVRVLEADAGSGAALHHDLVSGIDQFPNAGGHQTDPVLVNLDFFGHADFHGLLRWADVRGVAGYSGNESENCKKGPHRSAIDGRKCDRMID